MGIVSISNILLASVVLTGTIYSLHRIRQNSVSTTAEEENFEKVNDHESEVWYKELGTFDNGKPWRSLLRPVPLPQGPEVNPAVIYFYSRKNRNKSYLITLYPEIDMGNAPYQRRQPTAIIIHGFHGNSTYKWLVKLKDVYLDHVNANIMVTDWSIGSATGILQASSNARVIAILVVRLLKFLIDKKALEPNNVHLIGHSIGAHIASYIGKAIPGISRITALDPAQPLFEGYDVAVRLDKSDAEFVEVVHTNAKPFIPSLGLGMVKPHGHVDFYFNGGGNQPGCTVPDDIPEIHSIGDLIKFPFNYDLYKFVCSHTRSHEYLIEAYERTNGCVFWGHRVTEPDNTTLVDGKLDLYTNFTVQPGVCTVDNCIPFGYETINSLLRGVFAVRTREHSPFCIPEPDL